VCGCGLDVHEPRSLSVTGPVVVAKQVPRVPGEDLSEEIQQAMRAQYEELMAGAPAPVKGKPSAEQIVALQAFAQRKKDFLAAFQDEDELAFAKALVGGKVK
jgi:hypothetical protein